MSTSTSTESPYLRSVSEGRIPRPPGAPSLDLARRVAGSIEVQLINGNWEAAADAFRAGYRDHKAELESARSRQTRSRNDWLRAPVADLNLPLRDLNSLEAVACFTVSDAIDKLNSGDLVPNFAEVSIRRFWSRIEAIGLLDLRTLSEEAAVLLHKQKKAAEQNARETARRQEIRRREQVRAGGLGGRKQFARGPEQIYRARETG